MNATIWRAAVLPIRSATVAVDVSGSGRLARYSVSSEQGGLSREISSVEELSQLLTELGADAREAAQADPVAFAFIVCVLCGCPARVLNLNSSLWPDLERHFRLDRLVNQPRIENGRFVFLISPQYMPVLKVDQIAVDLRTLEAIQTPLIEQPWPPGG